MRALITGSGGFVGRHLLKTIAELMPNVELHGTVFDTTIAGAPEGTTQHLLNLCNINDVRALLDDVQPHQIYHLAAQASVAKSLNATWETLENNIHAQVNILEASLTLKQKPRILIISSGAVYGKAAPEHLPTPEEAPFLPNSPYGVSKITQEMLGLQYFTNYQIPIIRARPFNHFGPGQRRGFVSSDFAMQIAEIEQGKRDPIMSVGSLSAELDFTDVRDIVRAYVMLMEHGVAGEVYNVSSGKTRSVQTLLDALLSHATVPIQYEIDPALARPARVPVLWGDATKLRNLTGWQPLISFDQTVLDIIEDCRQHTYINQ